MKFVLLLGPMPDAVRVAVRQLVETARAKESDPNSRFLGFALWGGPSGVDFLDAEGELWSWCAWDDTNRARAGLPDVPRSRLAATTIVTGTMPKLLGDGVVAGIGREPAMQPTAGHYRFA